MLNNEVNRQASTLAYLQDFRLMMWITLATLPMILLLRGPEKKADGGEKLHIAAE